MKLPQDYAFSYTSSCYYTPEAWGLEQVDMADYSEGGYEYDFRIVWRDLDTKKLLSARDSGCSCPIPFENFTKESDFEIVTEQWIKHVLEPEVESNGDVAGVYSGPGSPLSFEEKQTFLDNIRRALYQ